ncbi:LNS2-domain-containing protein [Trichodelitschia bisporula]|uniref:LNS2-domain-containing protein n=1 Tax=Trichodelitschia bisporula TaxID=703511 RepID=A0A6G1I0R6_9PEZI|nr:LNS2-domain-containing protein [Trichodelitschia bisporula]
MQYVRSTFGSVSKTWNSINPATLSGAIDVIVVEQEDGTLACSPFHVRFGKFQLLRPSEKKVEFRVNDVLRPFPMKLGEGGEAFFVFETNEDVPAAMQTSPLASPANSPTNPPTGVATSVELAEPEPLDLADGARTRSTTLEPVSLVKRGDSDGFRSISVDWTTKTPTPPQPSPYERAVTEDVLSTSIAHPEFNAPPTQPRDQSPPAMGRSQSPPPLPPHEAKERAIKLSKKLWSSNIPSQITDTGDLMLDMNGYKSNEEDALRAEVIARRILSEELEGHYDIGALIGADEHGNVWIYGSEEAKEAADRKAGLHALHASAMRSSDAISDPGYHSDDGRSDSGSDTAPQGHMRRDSDSAVGLATPPASADGKRPARNYAKTLRLTSDQLKLLDLKPGANACSFSVGKSTCPAFMYLWRHDVPIVISDIDGTITKSDALGHVLTMIGRDWTHAGVAKLYVDIASNGYNILYLTSRSVGQADTTRGYLNGVVQDGYRLPKGPVIMSPDRTIAALRREVYLRKPEVFKMACLRDIMGLFQGGAGGANRTPFYAGFGNRLTDALSYRSVAIPPTRIFTINSNAEVSLHLLTLNKYRTSYVSMREIVDHYFPPVGLLVGEGGEEYTDFNYWRERPLDVGDFGWSESESESGSEGGEGSVRSEDEGGEDLDASYMEGETPGLRQSVDDLDRSGMLGDVLDGVEEDEGEDVEEGDDQEGDEDGDDEGGDEEEEPLADEPLADERENALEADPLEEAYLGGSVEALDLAQREEQQARGRRRSMKKIKEMVA